jgi:hypothetical protein
MPSRRRDRPAVRRAGAAALLPLAFAACLTQPPVGKEIAREPDVSLVRVRDDAPTSPMVAVAADEAATLHAAGAPMAQIVAQLWPDHALEGAMALPPGRFDAQIHGDGPDDVRARLLRAVADGLQVAMRAEERTSIQHRLVVRADAPTPAPTDAAAPPVCEFRQEGDRRLLKFVGTTQAFLAQLPTMLPDVVALDGTAADTALAIDGEFQDVISLRALLSSQGFDLAPEPKVQRVLRIARRDGGS